MKIKIRLAIATAIVASAIFTTYFMLAPIQPTFAQDEQPPPTTDRLSFGTVGITSGQTLRVSVANTILPNDSTLPPGPVRVVITFRGMNGQLMRTRSGEVIRRAFELDRGDATFLDLDYDALPPGPVRLQARAVVVLQPPPVPESTAYPNDSIVTTGEIINNANGRTQFVAFTSPAAIRGFNPQPDPPAEP
jgi:hypothetical protein